MGKTRRFWLERLRVIGDDTFVISDGMIDARFLTRTQSKILDLG